MLGRGTAGPCNHVEAAAGAEKLARVVRSCVGDACRAAGLNALETRFRVACFGMSGGPADKEAILGEVITGGKAWDPGRMACRRVNPARAPVLPLSPEDAVDAVPDAGGYGDVRRAFGE